MNNTDSLERDCNVLLELLQKQPFQRADSWTAEAKQAVQGILWNDLAGKTKRLSTDYAVTFASAVPGENRPLNPVDKVAQAAMEKRAVAEIKVDILIICPLAKELNPSLVAFGLDPDMDEHENIDGHKIFFFNETKKGRVKTARVAISVVTKQRNTNCALLTERLISLFDPQVVFLCGIGGGVKEKVTLGDVVVSSSVLDLAGGRAEPGHVRPRPIPFASPSPIDRQVDYFEIVTDEWHDKIFQLTEQLRVRKGLLLPSIDEMNAATLEVTRGTVVAGEQLIADGRLPELRAAKDDNIRSCDMEGSGFAQSCRDQGVQWLLFRGISDYGDPNKTECERWHPVAALAAAKAARTFIQTQLRLPSELSTWAQIRKQMRS
jgi:nucleoside phosphorylase